MKIKKLSIYILFFALLPLSTSFADSQININYDESADLLDLDIKDAYLDDVLRELSNKVGFSLDHEGDIHRSVQLTITGPSKTVIQTLVKPNSVILSQAETPPHKVTKVILLPTGTEESEYLSKKPLSPKADPKTGEINENHMEHYQRKLKQLDEKPKDRNKPQKAPLYTIKTQKQQSSQAD